MAQRDQRRYRGACCVTACVLGLVCGWPGPSLAQTDTVDVAAVWADLQDLDERLAVCEEGFAEFNVEHYNAFTYLLTPTRLLRATL